MRVFSVATLFFMSVINILFAQKISTQAPLFSSVIFFFQFFFLMFVILQNIRQYGLNKKRGEGAFLNFALSNFLSLAIFFSFSLLSLFHELNFDYPFILFSIFFSSIFFTVFSIVGTTIWYFGSPD